LNIRIDIEFENVADIQEALDQLNNSSFTFADINWEEIE